MTSFFIVVHFTYETAYLLPICGGFLGNLLPKCGRPSSKRHFLAWLRVIWVIVRENPPNKCKLCSQPCIDCLFFITISHVVVRLKKKKGWCKSWRKLSSARRSERRRRLICRNWLQLQTATLRHGGRSARRRRRLSSVKWKIPMWAFDVVTRLIYLLWWNLSFIRVLNLRSTGLGVSSNAWNCQLQFWTSHTRACASATKQSNWYLQKGRFSVAEKVTIVLASQGRVHMLHRLCRYFIPFASSKA